MGGDRRMRSAHPGLLVTTSRLTAKPRAALARGVTFTELYLDSRAFTALTSPGARVPAACRSRRLANRTS